MRRVPWVVVALGALLLVAGGVVFTAANQAPPADLGWTSYRPLEPDAARDSAWTVSFDDGWAVAWTIGHVWGAGLVVLGLLVLAGLGGWLLGRRSARTEGRAP
jgi:hypothetical protein